MRLRPSSYFLLAVLAVTLAIVVRSLSFPRPETKLLPLIIGGLVFILAAIELVRELRAKAKPQKETRVEARENLRPYFVVGAWIAGFFVAIYLLGFIIAIPLFVLSYIKSRGIGWLTATSLAVLTTIFIYVVFEWFLKVDLSQGLLLSW